MKNPSREYLKEITVNERRRLAEILGIRQEFLYQISAGMKYPSRLLAIQLEIVTDGKVRESDFDDQIRNGLVVKNGNSARLEEKKSA